MSIMFCEKCDNLYDSDFDTECPLCEEEEYRCNTCQDTGSVEILGDGENFECDVIGYKPCPECEWENPIQD